MERSLWAKIGAQTPNLQGAITHTWHVCSQHSFELPLRVNGEHKTQVTRSRTFGPSIDLSLITWCVLIYDRSRQHCITIGAGKMGQSCPHGISRIGPAWKFFFWPYNKSFIDQACLVKIAEYWPRYVLYSFFIDWRNAKKNLANIQPSWPHAW